MDGKLQREIDEYLQENWENVVADIESLVSIESVEDLSAAVQGAPYGSGPRAALDGALAIAERMGLATCDCEGYLGYADLAGRSATQIGIIGHVDVVPAGPGWSFEPFAVTREGGYLIGRGVADDKGPIVTALHAVNFWKDRGVELPYTIRVIFGSNEETNMKDVAYYREHYDDPAFLITPDAEFPVCYGEAGICNGTLASAPLRGDMLVSFTGGVAVNAVPGLANAVLNCASASEAQSLRDACAAAGEAIAAECEGATVRVQATGKSAHASTPELGVNAIDLLASCLLGTGALAEGERSALELVRKVTSCCDGSGLGVQASDEHFGDLTAVGGTVALRDGRLFLSIDFRYPTTVTSSQIEQKVKGVAAGFGATFAMEHDKEPFLMDPSSPAVQALLSAYNETTGESARAFTMKGGTYARMFSTGVSFGPEKPWEPKPAWVGGMHGPDEGIREDLLKQAFSIYVHTIGRLIELDLQSTDL